VTHQPLDDIRKYRIDWIGLAIVPFFWIEQAVLHGGQSTVEAYPTPDASSVEAAPSPWRGPQHSPRTAAEGSIPDATCIPPADAANPFLCRPILAGSGSVRQRNQNVVIPVLWG